MTTTARDNAWRGLCSAAAIAVAGPAASTAWREAVQAKDTVRDGAPLDASRGVPFPDHDLSSHLRGMTMLSHLHNRLPSDTHNRADLSWAIDRAQQTAQRLRIQSLPDDIRQRLLTTAGDTAALLEAQRDALDVAGRNALAALRGAISDAQR